MAKSKELKFTPTDEDTKAMNICFKNDLAYVLKPSKNANRYNVIKYQISNYKEVFYLKENNVNVEFTEFEGLKKQWNYIIFTLKDLQNDTNTLRQQKDYDVIDFIKDYDLNFNEGNVVKYVARAKHKGTHIKDLEKAIDYLERELKHLRKEQAEWVEKQK